LAPKWRSSIFPKKDQHQGLFFAKNENEWNSGLKATRGGWKKESRQNEGSFVRQSHGRNEAANRDTAA
jgi:hypothetical protein